MKKYQLDKSKQIVHNGHTLYVLIDTEQHSQVAFVDVDSIISDNCTFIESRNTKIINSTIDNSTLIGSNNIHYSKIIQKSIITNSAITNSTLGSSTVNNSSIFDSMDMNSIIAHSYISQNTILSNCWISNILGICNSKLNLTHVDSNSLIISCDLYKSIVSLSELEDCNFHGFNLQNCRLDKISGSTKDIHKVYTPLTNLNRVGPIDIDIKEIEDIIKYILKISISEKQTIKLDDIKEYFIDEVENLNTEISITDLKYNYHLNKLYINQPIEDMPLIDEELLKTFENFNFQTQKRILTKLYFKNYKARNIILEL